MTALIVGTVMLSATAGGRAQIALTSNSHPLPTQDCVSPLASASPDAAVAAIDLQSARLRRAGKTDYEVDSYLAAQFCLENIGVPDTTIELVSARSDMYLASGLYYDAQAKLYYSITNWHWLNDSYFYEVPVLSRCIGCKIALGGEDGIGTALSQSMTLLGSSLSYWHASCPGVTVTSAPAHANPFGVAYKAQDHWDFSCGAQPVAYLVDNTMFGGQEVISMKPTWTGCRSVQPFATYEHTWSSTAITGISLSNSGVGISVSSTANAWDRSAIGAPANVCG